MVDKREVTFQFVWRLQRRLCTVWSSAVAKNDNLFFVAYLRMLSNFYRAENNSKRWFVWRSLNLYYIHLSSFLDSCSRRWFVVVVMSDFQQCKYMNELTDLQEASCSFTCVASSFKVVSLLKNKTRNLIATSLIESVNLLNNRRLLSS